MKQHAGMTRIKCFGVLGAMALWLASLWAQETSVAASSTEMEQLLQQEEIRRRQCYQQALQTITTAKELIDRGETQLARAKLALVLALSSHGGDMAVIRREANRLSSTLDADRATQALQQKDDFTAWILAKNALQENPQNQDAAKVLRQATAKLGVPADWLTYPAIDENDIARWCKVHALIATGRELAEGGQYDAAKAAFQQAVRLDPANRLAIEEWMKLTEKIGRTMELARLASNQQRRTFVRQAWTEQYQLAAESRISARARAMPISMQNNFRIAQKLRELVVGEVNFNEATIEDAVRFLTEESCRLDPEGQGINFLLPNDQLQQYSRTFTLHVRQMPIGEVLRYVTQQAGVRYRVEEFAVLIVPLDATDDVLVTREFPVRPAFFEIEDTAAVVQGGDDIRNSLAARGVQFGEGAKAIYNAAAGVLTVRNTQDQMDLVEELVTENQGETLQVAVQAKLLEINQTDLNSLAINYALYGAAAFYDADGSQSGQSHGNIAAGTNLNGAGGLRQSDGLGGVLPADPAAGSASRPGQQTPAPNRFAYSGVIDGNVFSVMLEAISQKSSADLMTAPALVMNDGQQGKITVAREFYYPVAFTQPQVSSNSMGGVASDDGSGGSSVGSLNLAPTVIPAWPAQFESKPVGVVLTVKPAVTTDRKRVFLVIKPEITEFDGFINYGAQMYSSVSGYRNAEAGEPHVLSLSPPALINENRINQPVFSVRTVDNAQMEVQDGYTIILGGLIREDIATVQDKIPFLGDIPLIGGLFRSKAEQTVKRNLLIFVTVRILRPDGQPLNPSTSTMANPAASGS